MSDQNTKFGTMLNCMDGRTQEPVINWIKDKYKLDVIDAPNPAGPTNMILNGSEEIKNHYKEEVLISVNGHNSRHVVIVAHQECAANPISDEEQIEQIKKACESVKKEWNIPEGVHIIGLWLTKKTDLDWDINCLVNDQIPVIETPTYA